MRRLFLPILVLVAALSLAATAAYYSVFGISKLFSAQVTAVVIMAGILETSKLITAAYLERFWKKIHWIRKTYLMIAMLIMMTITSLGFYGFLVSAYQETAYAMQAVDKQVELQQKKRDRYEMQAAELTQQQKDISTQVIELSESLGNNVVQYTNADGQVITTQSSSTRKIIQQQLDAQTARRDSIAVKQDIINDSITAIDLRILDLETNSDAAAEIGPLKYVASITGKSTDQVVNWFILLFIIVFDPLAIILLISANKALGDGGKRESKVEGVEAPTSSPEPESPEPESPEPDASPTKQPLVDGHSPIADNRRNRAVGSKWWGK